jgi:dienelactone hydrolase
MTSTEWLAPSGPYPVGLVEFELDDRRHAAMYAQPPAPNRRIKVMAWHPAAAVDGRRRRRYFENVESLDKFLETTPLDPAMSARVRETATMSHLNAPVADGKWPTLVFNHGGAGWAQQNSLLVEELASHGFVVLAPFHPNESWTHQLPDGAVIEQNPLMNSEMIAWGAKLGSDYMKVYFGPGTLAERLRLAGDHVKSMRPVCLGATAHDRVRDNLIVVDCVEDGETPEAARALALAADTKRLGYFGMSYGGHVAALSCLNDPRAGAGVNLDGGFFTGEALGRELGLPFMALTEDTALAARHMGQQPTPLSANGPSMLDVLYERIDGTAPQAPLRRISIAGMAHNSFTDMPWLLRDQAGQQMLIGELPAERQIAAQRRFVLDFFDTYLRQAPRAFPRAALSDFSDIAIAHDRPAMPARERAETRSPSSPTSLS